MTALPRRDVLARLVAPAAVVGSVLVAFHYSLLTLLQGLGLDSPLAYLGLVPLLALGLAVAMTRSPGVARRAAVEDREVDVIVGVPLVAAALVVLWLLPSHFDLQFWVWRLDLLSLPLFAAGATCLLLGTPALWRLRVPLAFLALAWPVPWTRLLELSQDGLVRGTSRAVALALHAVPVATARPGDGTTFAVQWPERSFDVQVASACAGANSTLAFLLVGGALALLVRGSRRRRALWLASGTLVVWWLNVLRVLLVLVGGRFAGPHFALDVLHPVLGTVLLCAGVAVLLLVLPRFGLSLPFLSGSVTPLPLPVEAPAPRRRAGTRWTTGLALLLAAATSSAAVADARLAVADRVVSPLGTARVDALASAPVAPVGWRVSPAGSLPSAQRYFGRNATWDRLLFSSPPTGGSGRVVPAVSGEVIGTGSQRALAAFGVRACYGFHKYDVSFDRRVDLGEGVEGELFSYVNPRDGRPRTTLAWEWPVTGRAEGTTRYERVVLTAVDGGDVLPQLAAPSVGPVTQDRDEALRSFVRAFGSDLVAQRVAAAVAGDPRVVESRLT